MAEITRNRYLINLKKPEIEIGAEQVKDGEQTKNVSSITILLRKGEANRDLPE